MDYYKNKDVLWRGKRYCVSVYPVKKVSANLCVDISEKRRVFTKKLTTVWVDTSLIKRDCEFMIKVIETAFKKYSKELEQTELERKRRGCLEEWDGEIRTG